ncbi:MAG: hypothetical protein LBN40_05710 [Oscillospiraceae bacterium]|jgi:hypothetical protein|nr:hypothetical protein [Oscillospiraceae bacterium]
MNTLNVFPIPKELLPHTVSVRELTGGVGSLFETYGTVTVLQRVRCEKREKFGKDGVTTRTRGVTLYYDCENSLPRNFRFTERQVITFEGEDFAVNAVTTVLSASEPHHLKVELI